MLVWRKAKQKIFFLLQKKKSNVLYSQTLRQQFERKSKHNKKKNDKKRKHCEHRLAATIV